jgi:hypothetical protein
VNQLDLFGEPETPAPTPAFKRTREAEIMEALKRDLATLAGPPEYIAGGDRAFYEERVASYRAMLLSVVD